jgi:hypothetical protein
VSREDDSKEVNSLFIFILFYFLWLCAFDSIFLSLFFVLIFIIFSTFIVKLVFFFFFLTLYM